MIGQIKIRLSNVNQEPMVVYVSHYKSKFDYYVCEALNTGVIVFSEKDDLIDFDYKKFMVMYYEWEIQHQKKVEENYTKLLNEFKKEHGID